jgi:hypothetical protein
MCLFSELEINHMNCVSDPLCTRVPLDYDAVFYPYGYPARIRSNSALTLDAAEKSWGSYRCRQNEIPLDVRLLLSKSDSAACVDPPGFRSQGHLLSIVADRENFASLDLNTGFAFGWATEATAQNQEYFRQCLLDVMVYPLLEVRNLVSLHAACVMYRGKGILLAGKSGAGKSSLSYACARSGWTFVSDDTCSFQRNSVMLRVIGRPHVFKFRSPTDHLFSEFSGLKSTVGAFGKPTIEVLTRTMHFIRAAEESPVDTILFLNRRDYKSGPPNLLPLARQEILNRLNYSVWAVQLPAFEERLLALERLANVPAYELRYSEFDPTIQLLERSIDEELL